MELSDLKFQSDGLLSIVQFKTHFRDSFNYISIGKAIKENFVEVIEVSESGSVNDLFVHNKSDKFVFISDGDILTGAKQNRVLNTSVLIAPNSKTKIPVSCVEQGRWSYKSRKFASEEYMAPAFLRSSKATSVNQNLASKKVHDADQSKVWNDVSEYHSLHKIFSASSNLSDIFYCRAENFEDFAAGFKIDDNSNGISLFINHKLLHTDVFNRSDIYKEYFKKLLNGVYFDIANLKREKDSIKEAEAVYKTLDFIDKTSEMKRQSHIGIGVGTEMRFESESVTGLELEYDGKIIHYTGMNLK